MKNRREQELLQFRNFERSIFIKLEDSLHELKTMLISGQGFNKTEKGQEKYKNKIEEINQKINEYVLELKQLSSIIELNDELKFKLKFVKKETESKINYITNEDNLKLFQDLNLSRQTFFRESNNFINYNSSISTEYLGALNTFYNNYYKILIKSGKAIDFNVEIYIQEAKHQLINTQSHLGYLELVNTIKIMISNPSKFDYLSQKGFLDNRLAKIRNNLDYLNASHLITSYNNLSSFYNDAHNSYINEISQKITKIISENKTIENFDKTKEEFNSKKEKILENLTSAIKKELLNNKSKVSFSVEEVDLISNEYQSHLKSAIEKEIENLTKLYNLQNISPKTKKQKHPK